MVNSGHFSLITRIRPRKRKSTCQTMVTVEGDAHHVSPPRPRARPGKAPQRMAKKKKANALVAFQEPASSLVVFTTCISMFLFWLFVWKAVKTGRSSYTDIAQDSFDAAIVDHYRRRGAVLRARVGRPCSTCLRGLIATEDIRTGEKVFELPVALTHSLSGDFHTGSNAKQQEVRRRPAACSLPS